MSRAFRKETDNDPGPVVPAARAGTYLITRADFQRLPPDDERRTRAEIVDVDPSVTGFGAVVTVRDDRGDTSVYTIVNDEDARPTEGRIGISSPLALALAGKRVGERAVWQRPVGNTSLDIEHIDYR